MHNKVNFLKLKNLLWILTSITEGSSKLNRERPGGLPSKLSGTLYVSSMIREINIIPFWGRKIKKYISAILNIYDNVNIGIKSCTKLYFQKNSIDYIFTDPPFGDNLMYSELNFLWESWLKVFTNNKSEAIINKTQSKALEDYAILMQQAFKEYYRVLKPNRWITVVFHNSKSAVWNVIQEAITKAGFIIANVSVLDKQQGSFKQVTSTGAVKNDLVISAYKPKMEFETRFLQNAGEGVEEDFIKMHLTNQSIEPTIERTEQMLYSRMLAYYVQRGYIIRYDSKSFYQMLKEKFYEEDGFWFTFEQIERYREYKKKTKLDNVIGNIKGFDKYLIYDERTALRWLYEFLDKPKTYQEIHPLFTKVTNFAPQDSIPELTELLENNFIKEQNRYRRPQTEDENITIKQKREKELLREFETILLDAKTASKKIRQCRKEALIFGFEHCYRNNRFDDILKVAKKLDKKIMENSTEIKEFIEIAELKTEGY